MTGLAIVMIRQDYLNICGGDHCAAAILSAFEFWTKGKRKGGASGEVWIYKKQSDLQQDLTGLFGLKKIASGLQTLRVKGFLVSRSNPHNGQDKILQYRFERDAVDAALGVSESIPDRSEPQIEKSEAAILRSPNAETTPSLVSEKTTENLTLIPDSESTATALRVGAVAVFPNHIPDGDDPFERKTATVEGCPINEDQDRERCDTTLPPVPPAPSPAVPEWARVFQDDMSMVLADPARTARLKGWLEYAKTQNQMRPGRFFNPPGFAIEQERRGLEPPAGAGVGQSYVSGELAAFIEH